MAPRVHGASALGHAENAFLNGFLCVARAFDVPSTPHAENSQLFRGGPTRLTCSCSCRLYSWLTGLCVWWLMLGINANAFLRTLTRSWLAWAAHVSGQGRARVSVNACVAVCVRVCVSHLFWLPFPCSSGLYGNSWAATWLGLPYGSRMIKLLPKIRCLSRCLFRSVSLSPSLSVSLSMLDFRLSPYSLYMTGLPALILTPLAG